MSRKTKNQFEIWKELGIPENKIKKCGKEDNFWGPTGEEGPCGPTTEIHFNNTEVWNLVFNEYYQDKNGKLTPLKQKGVDTGMGLERLAMVVQDKNSVYETDLFWDLLQQIREQYGEERSEAIERMFRVIADHIRGSVFLISDGILPLNVERGYVLRRLLRRILTNIDILNLPQDIIYKLAKQVIQIFQKTYPEIESKQNDILTVIQKEAEKFVEIKKEGEKEFEKYYREPVAGFVESEEDEKKLLGRAMNGQKIMPGFIAFRLFTTHGLSLELIKEIQQKKE